MLSDANLRFVEHNLDLVEPTHIWSNRLKVGRTTEYGRTADRNQPQVGQSHSKAVQSPPKCGQNTTNLAEATPSLAEAKHDVAGTSSNSVETAPKYSKTC